MIVFGRLPHGIVKAVFIYEGSGRQVTMVSFANWINKLSKNLSKNLFRNHQKQKNTMELKRQRKPHI